MATTMYPGVHRSWSKSILLDSRSRLLSIPILEVALIVKNDELSTVILMQYNIAVACCTESWLTQEIPTQTINMGWVQLAHSRNYRTVEEVVTLLILIQWELLWDVTPLPNQFEDPDQYDELWILTRLPYNHDQGIYLHIIIAVVYHPYGNDLTGHCPKTWPGDSIRPHTNGHPAVTQVILTGYL